MLCMVGEFPRAVGMVCATDRPWRLLCVWLVAIKTRVDFTPCQGGMMRGVRHRQPVYWLVGAVSRVTGFLAKPLLRVRA